MGDYIRRNEALHVVNGIDSNFSEYIKMIPAADVRENKRGRWKYYGEGRYVKSHFRCSFCDYPRYEHYANNFKFCPNCGAMMEGVTDET